MKDASIRPIVFIIVQIPLQLDHIKTKEDVLVEISMLLLSVALGVGVLYATNIKNKIVYTRADVIADCFIALFASIMVHYAMLFYHLPYPRFIVDFFVSLFAYIIVTSLKKAGDKKIKKIAEKIVDIIE